MKNFVNFVLLLCITHSSYGRYLVEWTPTTDEALIEEALKKSLKTISVQQNVDLSQTDVADIGCETHFENGLHIKLTFSLEKQKWECALYKSSVEVLGIENAKCEQIEQDNPPSEAHDEQQQQPAEDNEVEADDEVQSDTTNQQNHDDEEEHDDEADVQQQSNTNTEQEAENDDEKDVPTEQKTPDEENTNNETNNDDTEDNQEANNE